MARDMRRVIVQAIAPRYISGCIRAYRSTTKKSGILTRAYHLCKRRRLVNSVRPPHSRTKTLQIRRGRLTIKQNASQIAADTLGPTFCASQICSVWRMPGTTNLARPERRTQPRGAARAFPSGVCFAGRSTHPASRFTRLRRSMRRRRDAVVNHAGQALDRLSNVRLSTMVPVTVSKTVCGPK